MNNQPSEDFFSQMVVIKSRERLTPKQVVLSLLRVKAWKQTDLANKIGISKQALNNYLSGRWGIPTQIKIKIAKALECDSSAIWDLGVQKND